MFARAHPHTSRRSSVKLAIRIGARGGEMVPHEELWSMMRMTKMVWLKQAA